MSRPNRQTAAFSLVEVTLALGIMAFCLVAVFGLLPTGLNTGRDAIAQTAAAGIAGSIAVDLRQAPAATNTSPRYYLTIPTAQYLANLTYQDPATNTSRPGVIHTLFLTADGNAAATNLAGAQDRNAEPAKNPQYRATLIFSRLSITSPPVANPPAAASTERVATTVRILITWPALADPTGGRLPQKANSSFETVVALDRN